MSGDLVDRENYVHFLQTQLAARAPVEQWIAAHCPADLAPPPQSQLIRQDLAALGAGQLVPLSFNLAPDAEPLGVAWVLAGSHLGNRAMLVGLPADHGLPIAFLSDESMIVYWKWLRPRLEAQSCTSEAERARKAAEAVFALFMAASEPALRKVAA